MLFRFFQRNWQFFAIILGIVVNYLALSVFWAEEAHAQGRLNARYEATVAGIQVGKGAWVVDISEDQFSASASGGSTGLLKAFGSGWGNGVSQGRIANGRLVPASYTATITFGSKKTETIRMQLSGGNVRESSIEPEPLPTPERIPVTDVHWQGVTDPMTGSLLRVPGSSDPVGPDACRSGSFIFDGRMRYDLRLEYKRIEPVKSQNGYQGPVVVCAIYFTPIAGYVPDRAAIKYITARQDMEVWFAPIAGTRVLVPYKVLIPTPIGMAALEATQFVTAATLRTTAKTQ